MQTKIKIEKEIEAINGIVQGLWQELETIASKGAGGLHPPASKGSEIMDQIRVWEGKRHILEDVLEGTSRLVNVGKPKPLQYDDKCFNCGGPAKMYSHHYTFCPNCSPI